MATIVSTDFIALMLRLTAGGALLVHGIPKAKGGWGKQAGQWIGSMGVHPRAATLVTLLELFGALFLMIGLLVPVVAAFFAVQFLGIIAMKVRKMKAGFMGADGKPGYELDYVYLVLSLAILMVGAGSISLDGLLGVL
ncbi:MAG: DoxX family protein [Nitrososphaerota archaeon]|nr:DoxX family protein [Nitrososphaerota archaeon]